MSHTILSVKLCELDEKIGRLHSRIYLLESTPHNELKKEIEALKKECEETEFVIRERLKYSRAESVSRLSEAYNEAEKVIRKVRESIAGAGAEGEEKEASYSAEDKILLSEYMLDFAVQAADFARLASMEAIEAQMSQQEKEENDYAGSKIT